MNSKSCQQIRPIPRLPVLGWDTFTGKRQASIPCIVDAPNLVFTNSGRASIYQALKILSIGPGDSVLVPTYHCPTMIAPISTLGAEHVFYPIGSSGQINTRKLTELAKVNTRAIIAPHYFGLPQPMAQLRAWCDSTGIALIEDCAHALFGKAGERSVGAWGDLAIASLTKFLPVPEGGCLICNRTQPGSIKLEPLSPAYQFKFAVDILEEAARHATLPGLNTVLRIAFDLKRNLRSRQPQTGKPQEAFTQAEYSGDFDFNCQLADTKLSAVSEWLSRHAALERIVLRRRHNYAEFAHMLSGQVTFHPQMPVLPDDCAPYVFPLWVSNPDPAYQELRNRKIPVFRWDRLWPDTPVISGDYGIKWSHHVFQFACHQDLHAQEIDRIVANVLELCN